MSSVPFAKSTWRNARAQTPRRCAEIWSKPDPVARSSVHRADVEAFRAFSKTNQEYLAAFEVIHVDGKDVAVPRQCLAPALTAAQEGSFLVVGEPGAEKSAFLNTIGRNRAEATFCNFPLIGCLSRASMGLEQNSA